MPCELFKIYTVRWKGKEKAKCHPASIPHPAGNSILEGSDSLKVTMVKPHQEVNAREPCPPV